MSICVYIGGVTKEYMNVMFKTKNKHPYARTTLKQMYITACGVKLWNSLKMDLKPITTIHQFKKMYEEIIIKQYEVDR